MADTEVMAHYLSLADYDVLGVNQSVHGLNKEYLDDESKLMSDADVIIYNTCTVKNPSEDKFFSQLNRTQKPVVLAGCIPQSEIGAEWLQQYSAVGVEQLHSIVEVVEKTLQGNVVHKFAKSKDLTDRTFIPVITKNPFIAIIPILQGCLGSCTYCKTKFARGELKSYPVHSIINQVRLAKNRGVLEVWLVSEDNGAYGLDIGTTFPSLLEELTKIQGEFKIRIGMFNPEYAYEYKDQLAKLIVHPIFFRFLHIPVQAGNDAVLKDMVRPYTVSQYLEAIDCLRLAVPDFTLANDIICGFPTESDDAWQDTMDLIRKTAPRVLNISKFYPRPETKAAQMKLIPTHIVKQRSKELTTWFNEQNPHTGFIGKTVCATITEKGKFDGSFIGRDDCYRQIIVKSAADLLGKKVNVRILSVTRDDLRGELVTVVT